MRYLQASFTEELSVGDNLNLDLKLLGLMKEQTDTEYCRLWTAPPAVILGAANRDEDYLFLKNIRRDRVPIARRPSGGGAVYIDRDCLEFSLIVRPERVKTMSAKESFRWLLQPLLSALRDLGYEGCVERVSDVAVDGMKISGNCQKRTKWGILHHGTLLFDVDIKRMGRYLRVPPERDPSVSHKAFVTSLHRLESSKRGAKRAEEPGEEVRDISIYSFLPVYLHHLGCLLRVPVKYAQS